MGNAFENMNYLLLHKSSITQHISVQCSTSDVVISNTKAVLGNATLIKPIANYSLLLLYDRHFYLYSLGDVASTRYKTTQLTLDATTE